MVSCQGFSSRNSDARWRRNRQRQLARKVNAYSKMAANNDSASTSNKLCLRLFSMEDETERGDRFWNTNSVEMKFSTEKEWLRRVRFAENKPNYGMRDLRVIAAGQLLLLHKLRRCKWFIQQNNKGS